LTTNVGDLPTQNSKHMPPVRTTTNSTVHIRSKKDGDNEQVEKKKSSGESKTTTTTTTTTSKKSPKPKDYSEWSK
jgi:hypothetical protein